uniref:NADH-ubiquinone oxidoreductase chain 2 n=1 Tax=Sphenophorus sp. BYU-CO246 TaxID=696090 RepID=D8WKL1_9CUCU|nr:NADH dehydrogenase subunit 2 [Sphenophorus sp. BYU-CO246]ACZ58544.1 NADH dehydrogenase subunit 2 [Sphenophorus sp. BYU-CO246]
MFTKNKIIFFFTMILGTFITISSYSWLSMWIGLEINLLSIIPLFNNHNNKYPAESIMKYFIVQAFASTMILFSICFFNTNNLMINSNWYNTSLSLMLNSAIFMKMGAAPFHFWVPEVTSGLTWNNILILLTWQKIAPMIMLSFNIKTPITLTLIIIISTIISGIQGMNQTNLKKIMAYSSINHTSWMISAMMMSTEIWLFYFLIYSLISSSIILMFKKFNIFSITQLAMILTSNKTLKFTFFLNFLSLGGLPPFLGFFPKWTTIYYLIENKFYFTSSLLIIFTLITLFFYLRLTFSAFSLSSKENLIIFFKYKSYLYISMNILSLMNLFSIMYSYSFL